MLSIHFPNFEKHVLGRREDLPFNFKKYDYNVFVACSLKRPDSEMRAII